MRILRNLNDARRAGLRSPVVTLGVFDGVHRGHRAVIERVKERAQEIGGDAVVVTFPRHPRAVLMGAAPQHITALRHRLRLFSELGVDATVLLRFDQELRSLSATDFVEQVFVEALSAQAVVLGYNNRFGAGARGDIRLLETLGARFGFEAEEVPEFRLDGVAISSTAIREAILAGRLEEAEQMLGRPFSVSGNVVPGDRIGRQLGFPTANLNLHHAVRPPRGVYGCKVVLPKGGERFGLVNIGVRPTLNRKGGETSSAWEDRDRYDRFEVHVLDFEGDLYGRHVEVRFLSRIRGERRFASVQELAQQIALDESEFRAWIHRRGIC